MAAPYVSEERKVEPSNTTRHRIAARERFLLNPKGSVWAARGALWR
jgi:hypothetical protein